MKQLLIAALAVAACGDVKPSALVGDPAPPYQAVTLRGDTVSTSDLQGRVVLLNVWATWCAPCREEIPFLQSLYAQRKGDGLEIVGVSVDAQGANDHIEAFARDFGMTYPIWLDPEERVQSLFMALGVPASYLIDRRGVLRWRRLGIIRETDTTFTTALDAALKGP